MEINQHNLALGQAEGTPHGIDYDTSTRFHQANPWDMVTHDTQYGDTQPHLELVLHMNTSWNRYNSKLLSASASTALQVRPNSAMPGSVHYDNGGHCNTQLAS